MERYGRMHSLTPPQQQSNWKQANDSGGSTRLQHRERLRAVEQIRGGGQTPPLTSSVLDYAEVEIPTDSVIYCDIPYEKTDGYQEGGFDFSRFYDWACRQTEPVFISSYEMPADRFECIAEFQHRSKLCATANNLVVERIFIPRGQAERGNLPPRQLSLFG